eukprot:13206-Heterococcus_DN1.PRE.3
MHVAVVVAAVRLVPLGYTCTAHTVLHYCTHVLVYCNNYRSGAPQDTAGDSDSSNVAPFTPATMGSSSTNLNTTAATADSKVPLVEDEPIPPMYLPGKIVHIYSYRGTYRAAIVPCDHPSLRRIELQSNLVQDHKAHSYFGALIEMCDVRAAVDQGHVPPEWIPFDAGEKCQCCKCEFTWASTSSSKAQQQRDKHSCRNCGALFSRANAGASPQWRHTTIT